MHSIVNFSRHIYVLYVAAQATGRSTTDKDGSDEDEYDKYKDEYDLDEYDEDKEEEDEEEEVEEEEEDSEPQSGSVKQLSKKFSNMSTSGKQPTGNLKTPTCPKKVNASKYQMHLPNIVYQWSDSKGQQHVSADILLLSGMQHDCINPKISLCGTFLEI